jgi:hypothetical protein
MAGINFVHCGLEKGANVPFSAQPGTGLKRPWATATCLTRPRMIGRRDIELLLSLLSDPTPFVTESLRID